MYDFSDEVDRKKEEDKLTYQKTVWGISHILLVTPKTWNPQSGWNFCISDRSQLHRIV